MFAVIAALGAAVTVLAHVAPFPFLLEGHRRGRSAWHMPPAPAVVYLTYDDGPNPTATPLLLDVLEREGVQATFFLIDEHVTAETAPIVGRMFEHGHTVALHSNDRWLMAAPPGRITARLQEAAARVEVFGGQRPCPWFRPHAG